MKRKNQYIWTTIIIALGLAATAIIFARNNAQIGNATIELAVPDAEAVIYFDNKEKNRTRNENEVYVIEKVKSGPHSILVAKAGYYPWMKTVTVADGETRRLESFETPSASRGNIITGADPEYDKIVADIEKIKTPTKERPALSSSKNSALWIEDNILYASWRGDKNRMPSYMCVGEECGGETIVTSSKTDIRNVDFFKNRDDVVIFNDESSIYAIEIDKQGIQNFQPIYKGRNVRFMKSANNTLLVKDGAELLELHL